MIKKELLKSVLEDIQRTGVIREEILENLSTDEREVVVDLYNGGLLEEGLDLIINGDSDDKWEILKSKIEKEGPKVIPIWKRVVKYAAIIIGISMVAYFSYYNGQSDIDSTQMTGTIKLKTGEDSVKIIKEGDSQKIVTTSGQVVGEQSGNKISYSSTSQIDELVYSELEIPYGKIFDLEFSDGTVVHLNSGTKIKYPIKFLKSHNREVYIEGEAYFKVSKDKNHPFIVHAGEVAVQVLGTEFNISSYKEDSDIKTVLVEGSVSMTKSNLQDDHVILKPGEKGTWNRAENNTSIEQVDVNLYTGWITGELVFRNESFESMAKKLERKYEVEIKNENLLLADKKFNARFNVNVETIEDVLKSISEIQKFEYQIQDDMIIIK